MAKHEWVCEKCGHTVLFRQPELPREDYRSEHNKDKTCCRCGEEMYLDEVFIPPVKELNVPTPEQLEEARRPEKEGFE